MVYKGFIGGMYPSRSSLVDIQECVNWYVEIAEQNSKNYSILVPTPGTVLFTDLQSSNGIRCLYRTQTNRLFAISDNKFIEIFQNKTYRLIEFIGTSSGTVSMADNGVQLILVDGKSGYILNLEDNVFTKITSIGFPKNCTHVQFINGRFVVNDSNNSQFNLYWSGLYDGLSWDGSVASAEGYADKLISIGKLNNQLWLFGELSTEVFYDSGEANQPYLRISGAFFDIGAGAANSVCTIGNTIFWLGSNAQGQGIVFAATGYEPRRISTHAIEHILQNFNKLSDAVGWSYQLEGHVFYVLTFPVQNKTLVYDVTTDLWHERSTYNENTFKEDRHIGEYCCYAFNKILIGSHKDGKILEIDNQCFTDNGALIRRVRTAPHIHNENKRLFYKSLELDVEKGVGLTEGQGSVPNIMLQYSSDGGYTWSNELWRTAGRIGEYKTRVKWFNLGSSRDRLFRVVYTDAVKCILVNAYLDVDSER